MGWEPPEEGLVTNSCWGYEDRMGFQGVVAVLFCGSASATCWWWFVRCWRRGEIETRTGLYRANVEVEEYWFTMSVFGVIGLLLAAMAAFMATAMALGW